MSLYSIKSLTKIINGRKILQLPELIIEKGKIYALVGANGTGKTTLLKIMAFLDRPTQGEIQFNGVKVNYAANTFKKNRRKVVLLDQYPILFSTTVYKNVEYGLKIRGVNKAVRRKAVDEALAVVGMSAFADAQAAGLSGGETQRVALARVLVLQPEVLLCDEPTASVDRENQSVVVDLLRELNKDKHMSIIFSTHDHNLAACLADETINLEDGVAVRTETNLLKGKLSGTQDNPVYLLGDGQKIVLPFLPNSNTFQVSIAPSNIKIVTGGGEPGINQIKGSVTSIALKNKQIFVDIDAGSNQLSVLVEQMGHIEQKIHVGQLISFYIPPQSIQINEFVT